MKRLNFFWRFGAAAAVVSLLSATTASAHVSFEHKATANGPYKATLNVPHGCSGSPTITVRLAIPEGFIGVKPAPKPGWTVTVTKGAYARKYDYFHGSVLSEGVKEVVWSGGKLADEHFDEFKVVGFVSDAFKAGDTIYFPVTQECEQGVLAWTDIPPPGGDPHALKSPAASLKVIASEHHAHTSAQSATATGGVAIEGAWLRATPGTATVGAGYAKIINAGPAADRLIGATFPGVGHVEIHEIVKDGDVMKMRQLDRGIELPAGQSATLAPGGLHLMLMNLSAPLTEGQSLTGEIEFEKAGKRMVDFKVLSAGANASPAAHDHSKH